MRPFSRTCLSSYLLALAVAISPALGEESASLHQQIDQSIASAHLGELSPIASDHEFLRRIYLTLVGRSPSVAETEAFLANTEPTKRATTIDQLLASDEFNHYFAGVLDVMLMERRTGKRVQQNKWKTFLLKSVQANQPFDQIVQSILSADGNGPQRGAAKFLLDRDVEPNAVTRDVGRIFMGRDLQCAQCHDHPNIVDYEQSEYYGIFAFVNRSYLFEDGPKDKKTSYVGEKSEGATEFSSVFDPEDSSHTIPRLLNELTLEAEPPLRRRKCLRRRPLKNRSRRPQVQPPYSTGPPDHPSRQRALCQKTSSTASGPK